MKRIFDITLSLFGLIVLWPIIVFSALLVYANDFNNPFYIGRRVGKHGKEFGLIKIRTMVTNAENIGGSSTSSDDPRVLKIGNTIRKYKVDELPQLINVLKGDMSFVGPRPNVKEGGVNLYNTEELNLLSVRPGITDFSSIVFSDEGEILKGKDDPDRAYNELIRPWKSRLSLIYVSQHNLLLDIKLILLTIISIFSKSLALRGVQNILTRLNIDDDLILIAGRNVKLEQYINSDI